MRLQSFPQPLSRLIERLPALPVSVAMTALLNLIAWPALRSLDWTALQGCRFCVRAKDTGMHMYFSIGQSGFLPVAGGTADVTFIAASADFMRLALRLEDPDTLFFNRKLLIEGDTNIGLLVKNTLDSVDIESIAGRLPAGKTMLRKCRSWLSQ